MMTVAAEAAPATTTVRDAGAKPRRRSMAWLGLAPFAVYVLLFLAIPAVLAIASGFFTADGAVTVANFAAFADPTVQTAFGNSFWISAVTSILGSIIGALICFALLGTRPDGLLRSIVDSGSSVLAQFGGLMLAFAFIATIGSQGFITNLIAPFVSDDTNLFRNFNNDGPLLYQVSGLIVVYLYFQIPLMVLSFMPALEGLKATWGEANATLGGSRFTYWTRIAFPILAPSFFGSLILLFANAFSSYATAAALSAQGGIIPLSIKTYLTSETIIGVSNVAGVLAFGMVIVMVVLMTAYSALQRRAQRWQR